MRDPMWRRYTRLWGRDAAADIADELAFHVEERVAELVWQGMSEADARTEALRRLGDVAEQCRDIDERADRHEHVVEWLGAVLHDARIGARQLIHRPTLSATLIVTLALGLGATSGIFSVIHAVLLRTPPFAEAERMVRVAETNRGESTQVGPGQFAEWQSRARAFDALAAYLPTTFNLTEGVPEQVRGAFVSTSFFETRYALPQHGRYFRTGDSDVVVVSDALFRSRFGGDASVIGRTVRLNGAPHVIIGVAAAAYDGEPGGDMLWKPLILTAAHTSSFGDHWLNVYGKLRAGVSRSEAQSDMERVSREIAAFHAAEMQDRSARVTPYRASAASSYSTPLLLLFGAVALVLLLGCVNVTNLLLSRTAERTPELAIRSALGAGRLRIARQMIVETLVLCTAGGAAAFGVAKLTMSLFVRMAPTGMPGIGNARGSVVLPLFLIALTGMTGMIVGVVPALRATRGTAQGLRSSGRSAVRTRDPFRSALVVVEVALALVLLTGAGLLIRSAAHLQRVDSGFNTRGLVTMRLSLASERFRTGPDAARAFSEIVERVRTMSPGVSAAAASSSPPLAGFTVDVGLQVAGRSYAEGQEPSVQYHIVSAGYFETMGIPLRAGRSLRATDRAGSPHVAVISEALARKLWPDEDPLGKRIACCGDDGEWFEVIGVSGSVRHFLTQQPLPEMYVPIEQASAASWNWFSNAMSLVVRANEMTTDRVLEDVRHVMSGIDATVPLHDVARYDALLDEAMGQGRYLMVLLAALAALALVLAAVGIYGVLSCLVQERIPEMGLRLALGATRADVMARILGQGALLTGTGLVVGVAGALSLGDLLASQLYETEPTDGVTYVAVCIVLSIVAIAACWLPARRAARVDPMRSLRA
jgi:putative ABC transport system permease protein